MLEKLFDDTLNRRLPAGTFAACAPLAARLDQLFPDDWSAAFWGLTVAKRHAVAAVLSGLKITQDDVPVLRRNLLMSDERFLMTCRFGQAAETVLWFLDKLPPRALPAAAYDALPGLLTAEIRSGRLTPDDARWTEGSWADGHRYLAALLTRLTDPAPRRVELRRDVGTQGPNTD